MYSLNFRLQLTIGFDVEDGNFQPKEIEKLIQHRACEWSDGRRPLSVELLQLGVMSILRDSLKSEGHKPTFTSPSSDPKVKAKIVLR